MHPEHKMPPVANRMLQTMSMYSRRQLTRVSSTQIVVQALMGGAFLTLGALLALLLMSAFAVPTASQAVVLSLGIAVGFFLIIMTQSMVFTENTVYLPGSLHRAVPAQRLFLLTRFWVLAWVGNLLGAFIFAWLINASQFFAPAVSVALQSLVMKDFAYQTLGYAGWWHLVLSGALASAVLGYLFMIAITSRGLFDKFVPLFFAAVVLGVAGFQYAPLNMGFFSLLMSGHLAGWGTALLWNLLPVSLGNLLGGILLVNLPILYLTKSN